MVAMTDEELKEMIDSGKWYIYYKNDPRYKGLPTVWTLAEPGHVIKEGYEYQVFGERLLDG